MRNVFDIVRFLIIKRLLICPYILRLNVNITLLRRDSVLIINFDNYVSKKYVPI